MAKKPALLVFHCLWCGKEIKIVDMRGFGILENVSFCSNFCRFSYFGKYNKNGSVNSNENNNVQ